MTCDCHDKRCAERKALYARRPCTAFKKTSTIKGAGDGLFAERDYAANEFVTFYSGSVLRDSTLEGDRVLSIDRNWNIDGSGVCRHSAAQGDLINHASSSTLQNCAFRTHNRSLKSVCIKTIKVVSRGQEFFTDYGPEFNF